jgi:hypothetical protein
MPRATRSAISRSRGLKMRKHSLPPPAPTIRPLGHNGSLKARMRTCIQIGC